MERRDEYIEGWENGYGVACTVAILTLRKLAKSTVPIVEFEQAMREALAKAAGGAE